MQFRILGGEALAMLRTLRTRSVQMCVTSPPYWGLRNYGVEGQLGLESTPEAYVVRLVEIFREVRRVLKDDGTLWLNLGDCYCGSGGVNSRTGLGLKPKDLCGIPWHVAFALQADGWYLRSDIIWAKPNPMPESVTDRPTKAHEYVFLLAKSERYYYDTDAIREPLGERWQQKFRRRSPRTWTPETFAVKRLSGNMQTGEIGCNPTGRNRRTVWTVTSQPFKGAHFATFPPKLVEPCILAGSKKGSFVLDPFNGAGTTGIVALQHGRRYVGIELNPEYVRMSYERAGTTPLKAAA